LFVRLAPRAVVVPTVVSGVVYAPALQHPLTRLRRAPHDRERVAATLQAFWQSTGRIARQMCVRVEFGAPLAAAALNPGGQALGNAAITEEIRAAVRPLLARVNFDQTSERHEHAYRLMGAT
jgi:hypothetical protein